MNFPVRLFLPPPQAPRFSVRGFEVLFLCTGSLGCMVSLPSCSSRFTHMQMWDNPPRSSSYCLTLSPLCPCYPSLPLLLVWMNVSSFTPWLSDFHKVCFSGSFGYFLFLNLLLSFFWLCEEAKCIYLCFHFFRSPKTI